jgi:acyl dehydratase
MNTDLVGLSSDPLRITWSQDDVILYALGVGLGTEALEFTTENSEGVVLQALPTYALVLGDYGAAVMQQLDVDPASVVHGAEKLILHAPVPTAGSLVTTTKLSGLFDKGSGTIAELTTTASLADSESPLFTKITSAFIRGYGGWGGDRGPSRSWARPDRSPDGELTLHTTADQALLYRLCGDRNPLHSDPIFAARAGFETPILHGLCSFGMAGAGLLSSYCDSRSDRFDSLEARFVSPVVPGEQLTLRAWLDRPGRVLFDAVVAQSRTVLDSGVFEFAT